MAIRIPVATGTSVKFRANFTVSDDMRRTWYAIRPITAEIRPYCFFQFTAAFFFLLFKRALIRSTTIVMIRITYKNFSRETVHILLMAPFVAESRLIGVVSPIPFVRSSVSFFTGITGPHKNMNTRS